MKKIVFAAAGLLLVGQVQAGPITPCTQSNLNGNYVMYQAAINKNQHTGRCEINVASGVIAGSCEFGHNAAGEAGFNGPVYGTANMNTNCSADLEIKFKPNPVNAPDFEITSNFDLQFTPNKEAFVGSFSNNFGVEGITNGTRYSPALTAFSAKK